MLPYVIIVGYVCVCVCVCVCVPGVPVLEKSGHGAKTPAGRPARPRTQHDYHHDTKVKPEAATAVTELLMMGGKTPETCSAVNERQDSGLENCCIWLVICLNCTMMHELTNIKHVLMFKHT
jgi:hypothetical protein